METPIGKKVLKRLDQLYFNIDAICKNEELSTRLVNLVHFHGIIEYITMCIKQCNYTTAVIVAAATEGIEVYTKLIYTHMPQIIMGCIFSPIALRFAKKLYDKYGIPPSFTPNMDMLICIKRHALIYPDNREICNEILQKYDLSAIVENTHILMMQDDVELVSKYFSRKGKIMNYILSGATECSSKKIIDKSLHYMKENKALIGKMSLPFIIKNVDLTDRPVWEVMMVDMCQFSKWDFLPYVFELYVDDEDLWKTIRAGLYKGCITLPFLQVLIQQMKYHNIPIESIILKTTDRFYGEKDVIEELRLHKVDEFVELHSITLEKKPISFTYSNLFDAFRRNDTELVLDLMFANMIHVNPRFLEEKEYIEKLEASGVFGFTGKVKVSFDLFVQFTNRIIHQMKYYELIIMDFNSIVAVKDLLPDSLTLRCLNRVIKLVDKITLKFLARKYITLIQDLDIAYIKYLTKVRALIDPNRTEWKKPEGLNLEEDFVFMYQFSFSRTDSNLDHKITDLIEHFYNKKEYKISNLIIKAKDLHCSYLDVVEILQDHKLI